MPRPGKVHQGAKKRFILGQGRDERRVIYRHRAGKAHLNLKKSSSRLSRLSRPTVISRENVSRIMRLMGR